jgi:hypothetical protein
MSDVSNACKKLLEDENVDISSEVDFNVNGKIHTLSFERIIDSYMHASDESKLVFLSALQKAINAKGMGVEKFFEGMGHLLLMTHLSDKLEA